MTREENLNGQRSLGRKNHAGHRFGRSWFSSLALLSIAIGVGSLAWPALAATPSDGTVRTESLEELLNSKSSFSEFDGAAGAGINHGARQIVNDARLAEQLDEDPNAAEVDARTIATPVKRHHLQPIVIASLAVGALLILVAAVLLIWSRIVHYREMRDAPSPMAFNYPRI